TLFMTTVDASGTLGQGVDVSTLASAAAVATNTANIATNTGNIATNTMGIATNAGNIATNTASIGTNAGNIASNATNIAALQSLTATQTGQINTLFGQTAANSAAIDRANEGVAMALAMESPMLPAGTSFALSGGVGYFESQGAGTLALTARVSDNASLSAGVGVGFDSGEVGARGGFQVAW
ncbi:MAG: YadA-like family protein, partial [Pseudomonadota bacterium]